MKRCEPCDAERHSNCREPEASMDDDGAPVWLCCCGRTIGDLDTAA